MAKIIRSLAAVMVLLLVGLSLTLVVMLTTFHSVRANPGIIYVDRETPGSTHDGLSWTTAYTNVQAALAAAVSSDEIWVAEGVYTPGSSDQREATFTLKNGVALYGGFAATETLRTERDWAANITVLSGDIDQNDTTDPHGVVTTTANIVGNNAYHVVTGGGTDNTAMLDGFILTGGQANGYNPTTCGGGMYNDSTSPTLTDVTFSGNTAIYGGGMYNNDFSSPTLANVTFTGNSATNYGGGVYNSYSSPTLTDVTFSGNSATNYGGGMYNDKSSPTLTDVTFSGNSAPNRGGGMYNDYYSSPTLTNVTFSGNTAANSGGGIYNSGSDPTLTNVILWGDSAPDGAEIYNQSSTPGIAYSDLQGCGGSGSWNSACGTDGGGNIDADPLFADAANGNLRLQGTSPAIDAGDSDAVPPGITTDLDGNPRFSGATVDMGAYEFQTTTAYRLLVTKGGNGFGWVTSAPEGIACPDDCSQVYAENATVVLTATVGPYTSFDGWQGCDNPSGNTCTLTLATHKQVTATFSRTGCGVLYAAPTAQGSGGCSGWANACTLQTALAGAISGDEIWVQAGVHIPTMNRADRAASFTLKDGVAVYGGFAATETLRTQRDWAVHITVLSGDIGGNDLTDPHGVVTDTAHIVGNNSYHVVFSNNVGASAVLDGFIITAGQANVWPDIRGGGMYNASSSPTLTNVTFSGNTATYYGGGMYNDKSSPTLTNVTFSDNHTSDEGGGGGMFNCNNSNPTLTNATFGGNTAPYGGGMHNVSSSPTLTNVTFSGNTALYGGGMNNRYSSSPTLTDVTFSGNTAKYDGVGGGMYNDGYSNPTLTNVTFSGNTANYRGGGMYNWDGSSPMLTNVTFSNNTATEWGGGMYNLSSSPTLTGVTFSGNTATYGGGGMYSENSSLKLTNVAFSNNAVFNWGGGMYNAYSSPMLTNVILWGDSAPSGPEIYNDSSTPVIAYSDIQGCSGSDGGWNSACGTDGGGNIDANPLFVDAAHGDLHLQLNSPAIDAGDNTAVPGGITTDLDGNPRFVDIPTAPDTGNGTPPIVDMGAYEAQCVVAISKAVSPLTVAPGQAITFTLTISNGGSITATHVVVTDTLPFLSGTSFTSTVVVTDTGHSPPYVWTVQDLAPGQLGVITVTSVLTVPLAAGTYTNTATIAADDDLWDDNNMVSVTFTVLNVAPAFTSTPVTTATQDVPYTYTATTEDANGADALTITALVLPAWLTLVDHGDGTATLSGTPTNAHVGDHAVVLEVTDSGELCATQSFTITVVEKPWYRIYLPLVLRNTQ